MYTITEYTEAITRELNLRSTTYPRIVAKQQKNWAAAGEDVATLTIQLTTQQRIQYELLADLRNMIASGNKLNAALLEEIFRELQRELRLRKQMYPRFIFFKRMDPATAAIETAIWASLVEWFHKEYVPAATWRKPSKLAKQ